VKRWLIYAGIALLLVLVTVGVGWPFTGPDGRRGLLFAGGVALLLQWAAFGVLVVQKTGSPWFLGAWVGSTLLRAAGVVVSALWVASTDRIDTLVALLTLVGLLFVLLLLEPVALGMGKAEETESNGTDPE
jgi:hypothetical protein